MTKRIHKIIWIALPFYIAGGFFYPETGIAAVACMAAPVLTAFFSGRKWCGSYCPRGSFLDFFLKEIRAPFIHSRFFKRKTVKWTFFALMMAAFGAQLSFAFIRNESAGMIFIRMVTVTSIIAVVLGALFGRRTWCAVCPMGTLAGIASRKRKTSPVPSRILQNPESAAASSD
jgi:polyferredoxin